MFGQNPTRKLDRGDGQQLTVQEVFPTIQGEGPYAGLPATFIRLWGCHLKCGFCDTDFESNPQQISIGQLVEQCLKNKHHLVVLTGGEPLRQNIQPLCDALHDRGHLVQVETAGSFDFQVDYVTRRPKLVVSPKTPFVHPGIAARAQAWKYVISALDSQDEDGLPVVDFQRVAKRRNPLRLARPPMGTNPAAIWLQPMDEKHSPGALNMLARNTELCVRLAMEHGYRVSLQQHKILNLP
jgi:7-carboxy-7-deazaguanine synthase